MREALRQWARALKRQVALVRLATADPRVPWPAKLLAACILAYALSPIDLIPDFIPVLGLLDDLLLVPAGIWLVLRLIPAAVMADLQDKAVDAAPLPASRAGAVAVVCLWLAAIAITAWCWA